MVTVLYFAACRERAGRDREERDVAGRTVRELLDEVCTAHPELQKIRRHIRVAQNHTFVNDEDRIADGDEIALIPPVAGGAPRVRVLDTPLSVDAVLERIVHDGAGAQVVLIGTVRNTNEGHDVEKLRYEAYAEMAVAVMEKILDEVEAAFPGVRGAVDHRVGDLALGDRAVVVAASAPHRQDAFDACQRIIDRLKEDAPIWKHEHRGDGVVWVGLGP